MKKILAFIAFAIATGLILSPPPIVLTVYDPVLGGINCGGTCEHLADGHAWTAEDYGVVAACPSWMLYRGRNKIGIDINGMSLICRDTGSLVDIRWNSHYNSYVIHIDVLYPVSSQGYPQWNYLLVPFEDVDFYWTQVE